MPFEPSPERTTLWTPPESGELYVPPMELYVDVGEGEVPVGMVTAFADPLSGMTYFTGDLGHNRWGAFGHSTLRGPGSFYRGQLRLIAEAGRLFGCRYALEPIRWDLYRYVALFWAVHYPNAVRAAGSWLERKQKGSWLNDCEPGERICPCKGHTISLKTVDDVFAVPGSVKHFSDLVQWLKSTQRLVSYVDVTRREWCFVCL